MPTEPLEALEDRIGESRVTVENFRIEPGKVEEFARSITDPLAAFRDEAAARDAGLEAIPAPLTYARVSRFPRYQAHDEGDYGFDLGFHPEYVLHGEQTYEYERPLTVGDVLTGTTTLTDVYQRNGGRAGTMTFAIYETQYRDQNDDLVLTDRSTVIETEGAVDNGDNEAGDGESPDGEADGDASSVSVPDAAPVETLQSSADAAVGDTGPTVVVEGVERKHFVKYAGASGDFNPIHYDEPYAREAGNPSVFGQGMFTAGVASRVVTDWFALPDVDSFSVRFQSQVFPGDTIVATGEIEDVSADGTVEVALEAATAAGETLLTGTATASLETN